MEKSLFQTPHVFNKNLIHTSIYFDGNYCYIHTHMFNDKPARGIGKQHIVNPTEFSCFCPAALLSQIKILTGNLDVQYTKTPHNQSNRNSAKMYLLEHTWTTYYTLTVEILHLHSDTCHNYLIWQAYHVTVSCMHNHKLYQLNHTAILHVVGKCRSKEDLSAK